MQFLFDIVLARINFVIVILLSVIYILRKILQKKFNKTEGSISTLNRLLRQYHKAMGVFAIILGLVHGLLSSDDIFTFNLGTYSWLFLVLLGASWYYKSKLQRKGWMYYHRLLAVLFISALVFHIIEVDGFTPDLSISLDKNPSQDISNTDTLHANKDPSTRNSTNTKYKDGKYTGNATGYRPGLVVQVTISNGAIANITIIAHNERDPRHYGLAIKQVPEEIIKNQSTIVDGVSGATRTSNGIKNAVNDALTKAVNQ
ncbi:MAG: putative FMN-binding domain protein [Firmicutes bacterium]|nr:putative FMN-binding domain protein [Bacillota bacterium]